jgi:DNA-binding transcriptional ArsR family regulator
VSAVSVADERWRSVLTGGEDAFRAAREVSRDLVRDTGRLGRLGWINLLPVLCATDGSRAALLDAVSGLDPGDLREILVGGRRVEPPARSEVTPWLRRAAPAEVREACLRVISRLPEPGVVPQPAKGLGGRPQDVLERVAPGVRYDALAGDLVLAATAAVHPVIVVVDEPGITVVTHPPLAAGGDPDDAASRLRLLARAAGDQTRMRVLQELRGGQRSLPELCAALASPRTTLLHHLALLRGAGLIDVLVSDPHPNVYRLRESGFESLAQAARAFTIR